MMKLIVLTQTLTDGPHIRGKCTKYRVQTNYSETVEKTFDVVHHVTMSDGTVKRIETTETETVVVPVNLQLHMSM